MKENPTVRLPVGGILTLTQKTIEEIRHPQQFLNPTRRAELWKRGVEALRGSLTPVPVNMQRIEAALTESIQSVYLRGNYELFLCQTEQSRFVAHVFPAKTEVQYLPSIAIDNDLNTYPILDATTGSAPPTAIVVMTTNVLHFGQQYLPSEGYRVGDKTVIEFQKRKKHEQIQHGGLITSMNRGHIALLNYDELQALINGESLSNETVIIEANWYMDSSNQYEVTKRKNLQQRRIYNCLGALYFDSPEDTIYFTCSSYLPSVYSGMRQLQLETEIQQSLSPQVTLRELAAFCNILARDRKAIGWRIEGLEYIGGGTYTVPYDAMHIHNRDHLLVYAANQ